MSKKIVKTGTIGGIIPVTLAMGDELVGVWNETKDLKVAQMALASYNIALKAAHAQLINKKLTGRPQTIKLLTP